MKIFKCEVLGRQGDVMNFAAETIEVSGLSAYDGINRSPYNLRQIFDNISLETDIISLEREINSATRRYYIDKMIAQIYRDNAKDAAPMHVAQPEEIKMEKEVWTVAIKPTVGRVVWYTPRVDDTLYRYSDPGQKFAAIIAYVWFDGGVNLAVFDSDGVATNRTNVTLLQDGDTSPRGGNYAEWMPDKRENGQNIREFVAWYPNLGVVIKTDTGYEILTSKDGLVWSPRTNPKNDV